MDSPSRPSDAQRWLRFKNVGSERIPPYAILGPQTDREEKYDAIETSEPLDFALRLGRPHADARQQRDAALFYVNGSQVISPKTLGRCTQTGMMQALIGYEENSPPAWGDGLSIDTSQTKVPFYLVPGSGAYKFIDFDGCPKTTFKDSQRTGYKFKVGWIVPASSSTVLDGVIIKDGETLASLSPGGILPCDGRDNPSIALFGLSASLDYSSETDSLQARGFHRVSTTGKYLFNFTARIRSTDSAINEQVAGTLKLICRTNRVGNSSEFQTADQVESLTAAGDLEETSDTIFHKLQVRAEDQPADTNLVEGEVTEKHRHWQTVSGSTVLDMTEGELLFIYNPTSYEIEVSGVSGTLVLLSGAGSGGGSSSSSSSESSGGSSSGDGASSEEVTALTNRVTTAESDINTLESDVGTLETTVSSQGVTIASHTTDIATNASGISTNASAISTNASDIAAVETDVAGHETRITDLETFEASAAASIASNASAISTNTSDIATNASNISTHTTAIATNASDIDDLESFQTTATASISANASDIDDLETFQATTEAIFAAAIADDTYVLASRDQLTFADGVLTGFTQGPTQMPSTNGTNNYLLKTNGDGTTEWVLGVHRFWEEHPNGHLEPKVDATYDIGLASARPRDLRLSRNAIIEGTLTLSGTDVNNFVTGVAAIFIGAIADDTYVTAGGDEITIEDGVITDFTQGAGGGVSVGHTGLQISRTSTTELEVATGFIHNHDCSAYLEVSSAITLDLTDSGDFVNSSSRATNTWYHVLIGTETSTGNVVAALSTTLAKPSGWDDWQMIGAWRTNATGSGETEDMFQFKDQFFRDNNTIFSPDYDNSSPGTTAHTVRAWCPPIRCLIKVRGRLDNGSSAGTTSFYDGDGTNRCDFAQFGASFLLPPHVEIVTNASGQYRVQNDTNVTFTRFYWLTKAFVYPIGEAGSV